MLFFKALIICFFYAIEKYIPVLFINSKVGYKTSLAYGN